MGAVDMDERTERDGDIGAPETRAADDRLTIGRFARLTGLSVGALRHYDELDLLRPVEIDRFTAYRRYVADQVEIGRAIARLRDLEVPLEEIRAVLGSDDPAEQRRRAPTRRRGSRPASTARSTSSTSSASSAREGNAS